MRLYSSLFLILLFLFQIKVPAQIPNSDFEEWTSLNPTG